MNTKLTLSLEKTVIEEAKSYAKKTGRSLSELVENYFKSLTEKSEIPDDIHPKVKKLTIEILTRALLGSCLSEARNFFISSGLSCLNSSDRR